MKYFVQYTEDTTIASKVAPQAMWDLVEATRPYLENLKKANRVLDWGFFGTGHGLYVICDVRSHAELHEVTELVPVRALCRVDSRPVLESGEFADVAAKIRRESLATYEKLSRK